MNNKSPLPYYFSVLALVISIIIGALVLTHFPTDKKIVGGTTNYDTIAASALQIGIGCNSGFGTCAGTVITAVNAGACSIQSSSQTIAASTTATVDCQAGTNGTQSPLPGITAGAGTQVTQGTTTPTVFQGLTVLGASASSTPGYITLKIFNGTGASFSWTATASSSYTYEAFHL